MNNLLGDFDFSLDAEKRVVVIQFERYFDFFNFAPWIVHVFMMMGKDFPHIDFTTFETFSSCKTNKRARKFLASHDKLNKGGKK
ncbi:MAG TPA: hypothetical protein P5277_02590 [Candidatus Paceibacterota bacterium]|nr:hypothetical protein [Candidatus Paceibacterota bacterium]